MKEVKRTNNSQAQKLFLFTQEDYKPETGETHCFNQVNNEFCEIYQQRKIKQSSKGFLVWIVLALLICFVTMTQIGVSEAGIIIVPFIIVMLLFVIIIIVALIPKKNTGIVRFYKHNKEIRVYNTSKDITTETVYTSYDFSHALLCPGFSDNALSFLYILIMNPNDNSVITELQFNTDDPSESIKICHFLYDYMSTLPPQ